MKPTVFLLGLVMLMVYTSAIPKEEHINSKHVEHHSKHPHYAADKHRSQHHKSGGHRQIRPVVVVKYKHRHPKHHPKHKGVKHGHQTGKHRHQAGKHKHKVGKHKHQAGKHKHKVGKHKHQTGKYKRPKQHPKKKHPKKKHSKAQPFTAPVLATPKPDPNASKCRDKAPDAADAIQKFCVSEIGIPSDYATNGVSVGDITPAIWGPTAFSDAECDPPQNMDAATCKARFHEVCVSGDGDGLGTKKFGCGFYHIFSF